MCARHQSSTRASSAAEAESQRLWRLAGMGGTLASEILGGALVGWLLDKLFGTTPTLLIIFTVGGVIVGMTTFIRSALRQQHQSEEAQQQQHPKQQDQQDPVDAETTD